MKNKPLIITLIVIVVGFVAWMLIMQSQNMAENNDIQDKAMQGNNSVNSLENENEANSMKGEDSDQLDTDNKEMMQTELSGDTEAMSTSGNYAEYSAVKVEEEQAKGNTVVLFFHAPWCPFCRTADQAFTSNITEIPAKVTVLKTDYDSNSDLKKKYAVTYQHTFVQIDAEGNSVTKWNGGDIENLKSNLK